MIDIVLMLIIIFFVSSFCAVRIWKKTNFVKMVYVEEGVSIILYIIPAFFTGLMLILYFLKSDSVYNSWVLWTVLLLFDIIMLLVFCFNATNCIYLEKNVLYQKNLFQTKHIKLTNNISIVEKIDRVIVRCDKANISINFRHLAGDTIAVLSGIKAIIDK